MGRAPDGEKMVDCVAGRQKSQREDVEHQTSW